LPPGAALGLAVADEVVASVCRYFQEFDGLPLDDLIKHALKALSGTTGEWPLKGRVFS
jgi:hypothetical protein